VASLAPARYVLRVQPPSHNHLSDGTIDGTASVRRAKRQRLLGVASIAFGVLVITSQDALMKSLVSANYPVLQLMAIRATLITAGLLGWSLWRTRLHSVRTSRLPAHAARALVGFFAPALFFIALGHMPLADTTILFFAAPFLMTALAVPVLNERVPRSRWLLIATGFLGVVIAAQPSPATFQVWALLPLGAAAAYSVAAIMGRWLRNTESVFRLVFYVNLGHALIASCFLPFVWQPMSLDAIGLLMLCAALACGGQFLFTYALRVGPVGLIAPFEYTALVWSVALGYVFFSEVPTLQVLVGALVVGVSGIALTRNAGRDAAASAP
jgi:drug/metabolite transporter (DMT)-like permease